MEDVLLPVRLVRDQRVVVEATGDFHLIRFEPCLHPKGTSGPALAVEAVADRDRKRVAFGVEPKLPAETGRLSRCHRPRKLTNLATPSLVTSAAPAPSVRAPETAWCLLRAVSAVRGRSRCARIRTAAGSCTACRTRASATGPR